MTIIYFLKGLIDTLTDPMIFLIVDQEYSYAIYEYSVMVGRSLVEFILGLSMLYLFYRMISKKKNDNRIQSINEVQILKSILNEPD